MKFKINGLEKEVGVHVFTDAEIGAMSDKEKVAYEIEVMQKYLNGRCIEYHNDKDKWSITKNPIWNWGDFYYRVVPEPPKPVMVPLDFYDLDKLINTFIKHISTSTVYLVEGAHTINYKVIGVRIRSKDSCDYVTFETLRQYYTRLDGTQLEKEKK